MTAQLQPIRDILINKKPPYYGVLPVSAEELVLLYYGKSKDTCSRIDFLQATDEDLQRLSSACDPATFGLDQEDVLDETYRKAGKLDSAHFSTKLNVDSVNSSLMNSVRFSLLQGHQCLLPMKAELYKLNVYGKDSFFKKHMDTPRQPYMFGSLVVILPTHHEGGSLVLRYQEEEWTFDSAKEISVHSPESPHVAYIAFYGDVEHEVTMVESGHRVTLTYNLYFEIEDKARTETLDAALGPTEGKLSSALQSLLADPSFLPEGGHIGFGLHYKYPVERKAASADTLSYLDRCLKGSDAMIFKVCDELKLNAELMLLYEFDNFGLLLLDHEANIDGYYDDEPVWESLIDQENTKVVERFDSDDEDDEKSVDFEVIWATDIKPYNQIEVQFATYGNEVMTNFVYGQFCIIVYVGPVGDRTRKFEYKNAQGH